MAVSSGTSINDERFIIRLIECVQKHPCLYNPHDENYGNRHSSAQFRTRIWQKLCKLLDYNDDPQCLQSQWKRIRDKYVRDKKKRRNALGNDMASTMENVNGQQVSNVLRTDNDAERSLSEAGSNLATNSMSGRIFECMRWIDPFLIDGQSSNNSGLVSGTHAVENSPSDSSAIQKVQISPAGNISQGQIQNAGRIMTVVVTSSSGMESVPYFENIQRNEPNQDSSLMVCKNELMANNFDAHESGQMQQPPNHSQNDYANKQRRNNISNGASGVGTIVGVTSAANTSPSSSTTGSEIDVGSVNSINQSHVSSQPQGNVVILSSASQQNRQQQTRIMYSKAEPHQRSGTSVQTSDGSVYTLLAQGVAPMKKDPPRTSEAGTVAMVIDTTNYYQHGNQKMYRLVNFSEMNHDLGQISTGSVGTTPSEIKIITFPRMHQPNDNVQRRKRSAPGNVVNSLANGRGQLGEEMILEEASPVPEKTVALDQSVAVSLNSDRMLIDHSSVNVAGTSNMLIGTPNLPQIHLQHSNQSQQHTTISSGNHQIAHHVSHPIGVRPQLQAVQQRFIAQPMTIQQQPQYTVLTNRQMTSQPDDELDFANSIATHLSRLNDDEKAVAKMNIQRILMDARFGIGACARMIHDDDLAEGNGTNSSHDMVNTSQQLVDPSARR